MIEYTSIRSSKEIKALGYSDIGIFIGGSEDLDNLLMDNKDNLMILKLNETIFNVFKRESQ